MERADSAEPASDPVFFRRLDEGGGSLAARDCSGASTAFRFEAVGGDDRDDSLAVSDCAMVLGGVIVRREALRIG